MIPWWQFLLIGIAWISAVIFLLGGFTVGIICSIRGFPSKAYQIFAVSFAVGMPSVGIALALSLQDRGAFFYSAILGTLAALVCWLMSRITKL